MAVQNGILLFSLLKKFDVTVSRMAHSIFYSFPLEEHKKFKKPLFFPDVKQISVSTLQQFSLSEMSRWGNQNRQVVAIVLN